MSLKGRLEREAKRKAREIAKQQRKSEEVQSSAVPQPPSEVCGVVYYNTGTRCLVRLIVSIFSLRQVWAGEVLVLLEGDTPEWVFQALHAMKAKCKRVAWLDNKLVACDNPLDTKSDGFHKVKSALVRKPFVPLCSFEFDKAIFLDADTVVVDDISGLFELPAGKTFGAVAFSNWVEHGRMISGRINSWNSITEYRPHQDRPAVNTGVFVWTRGSEFIPEWQRLTCLGAQHPEFGQASTIMSDEIACQCLLDRDDVVVFDSRYGESGKFGVADKPVVIHFHGSKHLGAGMKHSGVWQQWFERCRLALKDVPLVAAALEQDWDDGALRDFRREQSVEHITLVLAVDENYLPFLKLAWPIWMARRDLSRMPVLIFLCGLTKDDPRLDFVKCDRVAFSEWNFDKFYGQHRTSVFAAFIFGVAQNVNTPFWMKLDVDTVPGDDKPLWDANDCTFDLVANAWGFTKVKHDPVTSPHWLNRLDEWWFEKLGKSGLGEKFPKIKGDKFSHQRHISKIALERTACTRLLAKELGGTTEAHGKMPIPSQDTLVAYFHQRCGTKVKYKKIPYRSVRLETRDA